MLDSANTTAAISNKEDTEDTINTASTTDTDGASDIKLAVYLTSIHSRQLTQQYTAYIRHNKQLNS